MVTPSSTRRMVGAVGHAALLLTAVSLGACLDRSSLSLEPEIGGSFEPTGHLVTERSTHNALLLADGRVLVLGGDWLRDGWSLPAEVYDPRTGGFTSLDPSEPGLTRGPSDDDGFSATLLDDGRVLVAGGWDGNNFVDPPWQYERDAVLFDAATGTSTRTSPMNEGRTGHVATRLPDGRILMVGGAGIHLRDRGPLAQTSAEIYDPATGKFSLTGSMVCPRAHHGPPYDFAAVILPSGRVLVTGGDDPSSCLNDEIYDPATGHFASVLTEGPREGIPTVILSVWGRVHRYDLRSGTATDITPGPDQDLERVLGPDCRDHEWDCRGGMTTTLLDDGRVLVAGGWETVIAPPGSEKRWRNVVQTAGEVLDPATGTVRPTGTIVQPRQMHTATLLADGRVLLIGGETVRINVDVERVRTVLSSAEIFTPRRASSNET